MTQFTYRNHIFAAIQIADLRKNPDELAPLRRKLEESARDAMEQLLSVLRKLPSSTFTRQ